VTVRIRSEAPADAPAVRRVHQRAFAPSPAEARLVELLRSAGKAAVSLVATFDGQVAGHILFSSVSIEHAPARLRGLGLAPLGVLPEHQGKGIGSALVREGLRACMSLGCAVVVVLGEPSYYSRFGFARAGDFGLANEYGADDAFMAMELEKGALQQVKGLVTYAAEFAAAGA